jgi:putative sugar O-methyltransferase
MQQTYQIIIKSTESDTELYNKLVHWDWQNKRKTLQQLILGQPNENFLSHPTIQGTMVRKEYGNAQQYEESFLMQNTNEYIHLLINRYQETYFGGQKCECKHYNWTVNSLGQMYYLIKALTFDDINNKPESSRIIEYGGGFGNLARIAKLIFPNVTYIIIDLPEICAIQSLYLRKTVDSKILVHTKIPSTWESGAIHIVPIHLLPKITLNNIDLFISGFALTESTPYSQKQVIKKNFFNALRCYIVGLAKSPKWISITPLIQAIQKEFSTKNTPYHASTATVLFYEICGIR